MSAYVVDPETINIILAALVLAKVQEKAYPSRFPSLRYLDTDLLDMSIDNPAELGRTMYAMNVNAVEQRYPDSDGDLPGTYTEDDRLCEFKYQPMGFNPPTAVRAYKALACYLYQCMEGDVDSLPLYKALDEYKAAIAMHIVDQSPEYESAPWA